MSITNFALHRVSSYFILLRNRVLRRIFGPRRDEVRVGVEEIS
jgi:hypothetical protein